ncbi:hypothetical protein ACW5WU_01400 [Aeromonas encheleia]|nr:hypothetical protein [Aeromonas encheleia]
MMPMVVGVVVGVSVMMPMVVGVVVGVSMMMPVSLGLAGLHSAHPVVVVMDIPLMVVVMVNDQGARRWLPMSVLMVVIVAVLGMMLVFVLVFMFMIVPGDSCLAASAYATHINLPRCR